MPTAGSSRSRAGATPRVAEALAALGVRFELHEGETLVPPGTLRNRAGAPFSVFSHFARAFAEAATIAPPLAPPRALPPLPRLREIETAPIPTCGDLGIAPNPRLLAGGEAAARERLRRFARGPAAAYD